MPKLKPETEKDVRGRTRTFDRFVILPPFDGVEYPRTRYISAWTPLTELAEMLWLLRPNQDVSRKKIDPVQAERDLTNFRQNLMPFCKRGEIPAAKLFAGLESERHLAESAGWCIDTDFAAKWKSAAKKAAIDRRSGKSAAKTLVIPPFDGKGEFPKKIFFKEYVTIEHVTDLLAAKHGAAHALALRRGLDAACYEGRVPAWRLLAGTTEARQPHQISWSIERWFVERLMQTQAE